MTQTTKTTGVSNTSSIQVSWMEDYYGLYNEVKLLIKEKPLEEIMLGIRYARLMGWLERSLIALAAKELEFNSHYKFEDVKDKLLKLRKHVLSIPRVNEDELLAGLFKRTFKRHLNSYVKEYFDFCKKSRRAEAEEYASSLSVFDVKYNRNIKL